MAVLDRLGLKQIFSKNARLRRRVDFRQSMADRSEEGVAVIEIDGTLQFANNAWAVLHGYAGREELIGKNIKQFYAGRAGDDFDKFVAQTKLLGWYIASVEQSRRDGTCFPAQLKMAVLKDDSAKPNAILLVVADLSRIGRMQEIIRCTTGECENLRARIKRLEEQLARRGKQGIAVCETGDNKQALSVPEAEMKQLAEMAKRFK